MKKKYSFPESLVVSFYGEALMLNALSAGTNSASEGCANRRNKNEQDWSDWEEEDIDE